MDDVPEEAKSDVVNIARGYKHALALKKDGSIIAWGREENGTSTYQMQQRVTI